MRQKLPSACVAAALILCGSAAAQTAPPPEPGAAATPGQSTTDRSDPSTSTPSTINRSANSAISQESSRQSSDADMSTAAERRPKAGREARMGGITAGSIVQNPAGEPIGRVRDIVPDANTGEPAYVVIATRSGHVGNRGRQVGRQVRTRIVIGALRGTLHHPGSRQQLGQLGRFRQVLVDSNFTRAFPVLGRIERSQRTQYNLASPAPPADA